MSETVLEMHLRRSPTGKAWTLTFPVHAPVTVKKLEHVVPFVLDRLALGKPRLITHRLTPAQRLELEAFIFMEAVRRGWYTIH